MFYWLKHVICACSIHNKMVTVSNGKKMFIQLMQKDNKEHFLSLFNKSFRRQGLSSLCRCCTRMRHENAKSNFFPSLYHCLYCDTNCIVGITSEILYLMLYILLWHFFSLSCFAIKYDNLSYISSCLSHVITFS